MAKGDRMENEEILLITRPSRLNFLGSYVLSLIFIAAGVLVFINYLPIPDMTLLGYELNFVGAVALFSLAVLSVISAEVKRLIIRYKISDFRVFKIVGILRRNEMSIPFQRMERCDVEQSFIDRIIGIGDVRVDSGEDHFYMRGIPKPEETEKIIFDEGIRKQRPY